MKVISSVMAREYAKKMISHLHGDAVEEQYNNQYKINRDADVQKLLREKNSLVPEIARAIFAKADTTLLEDREREIEVELGKKLKKYNLEVEQLNFNPSCKKCQDTGKIFGEDCDCLKKFMAEYIATQLSENTGSFDFESSEKKANEEEKLGKIYAHAKEFVERYPDVTKNTILMYGKPGTGKTHLAKVFINELAKKDFSGIFISSFALEEIFMSHQTNATSYNKSVVIEENYQNIKQTKVLVVDDLGTENLANEKMKNYFLNLLDQRQSGGLLTIFTTNLKNESMQSRYGERFFSRLISKQSLSYSINEKNQRI